MATKDINAFDLVDMSQFYTVGDLKAFTDFFVSAYKEPLKLRRLKDTTQMYYFEPAIILLERAIKRTHDVLEAPAKIGVKEKLDERMPSVLSELVKGYDARIINLSGIDEKEHKEKPQKK